MSRSSLAGRACLAAAAVACLFAFHQILVSPWCDADSMVLPEALCGMHPTRWVTKGYSPHIFDLSRMGRPGSPAATASEGDQEIGNNENPYADIQDEGLVLPDKLIGDSHADSAVAAESYTQAAAEPAAASQGSSKKAAQKQTSTQQQQQQPTKPEQGSTSQNDKQDSAAQNSENAPQQPAGKNGVQNSGHRKGGRLPPVREMFGDQEVIWEKPWAKPRGIFLLLNGCNHGPDGWWDSSPACPQCLGLPEEKAILRAGIMRGYVGIALGVVVERNKMRCWANLTPPAWNTDMKATVATLRKLMAREKWEHLPIYAWGGSAGGTFAARLPYYMPLKGIMVQLKSIRAEELDAEVEDPQTTQPWQYPKVFYAYNRRDPVATERAKVYTGKLADQDVEFVLVGADPQPVTPTFFATRIPDVNQSVSQQLYDALKQGKFLDEHDYLINDPRKTDKVWQPVLREKVPYANTARLERFVSPIFEELNWAYSNHQGISDTTEPAFEFFETGKRPDTTMLENKEFWDLQGRQQDAAGSQNA